jgi:O-antigen/teichoic acid export membrane protein
MTASTTGAPARGAGGSGLPGIARGGVLNLVGAGITAVTGVLLVVVVTRALPQAQAGTFFALTSLFLLAEMVARLGTGTGLVYFIARLRRLDRAAEIGAVQRAALTPVVVVALITSAVLLIWTPAFAGLVGGDSPGTRTAIVVLALLLPVTTLSDTLLAATRGYATMLPTVALDKVGRPVLQFALVALTVTGGSLALLAGAWAVPWAVSAVLAWWWLHRLSRGLPTAPGGSARPRREVWREFWVFTWPRAVNSLAALALQRLDVLLVTVLSGPAAAAVYTAATRFLVVGQLVTQSISTAAQPRLAEVLAVDDRASASTVYRSATGWIVLLTWPLYLLCAVFAESVLSIFGEGYSAGRPVILVLAGAMLFATACGMVDMLLNMAGRTAWTLANSLVALVVMVVVDLLLIPPLGILGASIGWAAAIVANNLLPLVQLVVAYGLHPFGRATLSAAGLAGVCFGVLPVAARLLVPGNAAAALGAVAVGGVLYLLAIRRWRAALGLPSLRSLRPRRRRPSSSTEDDRSPLGGNL